MTSLPEQLVLAVKDQLRNMRYQIRSRARDRRPEGLDLLLPLPVVRAADRVFSQVEATAAGIQPQDDRSGGAAFPRPIGEYLDDAAAADFTAAIYGAFKTLLRRFGSDVFLVSEQAIDAGLSRLRFRRAGLIAAARDETRPAAERAEAVIELCAALAVEVATAQPIRELMPAGDVRPISENQRRAPNEYCALAIGLALAIASKSEVGAEARDGLIDSADLAVDARFNELYAALKSGKPAAAVAAEFAALLPFLP